MLNPGITLLAQCLWSTIKKCCSINQLTFKSSIADSFGPGRSFGNSGQKITFAMEIYEIYDNNQRAVSIYWLKICNSFWSTFKWISSVVDRLTHFGVGVFGLNVVVDCVLDVWLYVCLYVYVSVWVWVCVSEMKWRWLNIP